MDKIQTELVRVSTTGPEPLLLTDAKLWLRVDGTEEDKLIEDLIMAARQYAETFCRRSFTQGEVWRLTLDHFPYPQFTSAVPSQPFQLEILPIRPQDVALSIPMGPVSAITNVAYLDGAGVAQVLSSSGYTVLNTDEGDTKLFPAFGSTWPATQPSVGAVVVNGMPQKIPYAAELLLWQERLLEV